MPSHRMTKAQRLELLYPSCNANRRPETHRRPAVAIQATGPRVAQYKALADEVWRLASVMGDSVARTKERVVAVCVRDFGTAAWHYEHVLAYVMRLSDAASGGGVRM